MAASTLTLKAEKVILWEPFLYLSGGLFLLFLFMFMLSFIPSRYTKKDQNFSNFTGAFAGLFLAVGAIFGLLTFMQFDQNFFDTNKANSTAISVSPGEFNSWTEKSFGSSFIERGRSGVYEAQHLETGKVYTGCTFSITNEINENISKLGAIEIEADVYCDQGILKNLTRNS